MKTTSKVKRIDVHSHVLPRELIELIRQRPRDYEMRVEGAGDNEKFVRDDRHGTPLYAEFFDADAKVEGMDRKGIDITVISVTPVVFFYWLAADAGLAACRVMNDGIARMALSRPDRLRGMATLPMQDTDAAVAELERVVKEHGFRSVELGCRIKGQLVSDAKFRPVLKRAQELGVFIFTHPYIAGSLPSDLGCYYLGNTAAMPFDTALMAAHLMFSGALDELPALRIILAHGGGHLPYQIGRLAHGYKVRKEARVNTLSSPMQLLRRFYFDALTHDADALRFLIGKVGADRVTIGTDAPFDMAEDDPIAMINAVPGLTDEQRARIFGLNALELLGESQAIRTVPLNPP
jgi:aminocarboxymuconate-semialdehyde decarboxylase